jgi:hypothetical protein
MTSIHRDLTPYASGDRIYSDGMALVEFKAPCPSDLKQKCIAAEDMFSAIKNFVDQYITTGNATATTEQLKLFCAAYTKAKGDL